MVCMIMPDPPSSWCGAVCMCVHLYTTSTLDILILLVVVCYNSNHSGEPIIGDVFRVFPEAKKQTYMYDVA